MNSIFRCKTAKIIQKFINSEHNTIIQIVLSLPFEYWLNQDHISTWWINPAHQLAECLVRPENGNHALICNFSNPIGYFRWKKLSQKDLVNLGLSELHSNAIDIDLMIGEYEYIGKGIGPIALNMLLQKLSIELNITVAGLGTSINNHSAIKAFEKCWI